MVGPTTRSTEKSRIRRFFSFFPCYPNHDSTGNAACDNPAAVTNTVTLPAIWLFAIIFYWTPPHFWALSLLIQKDYEKASIPMLPVVMGERETRKQILLYSLLLLAVTMVLFAMRAMGLFYLVCALVLGGILVYMAVRLIRDSSKKWARTLFWYSNCYLAVIFAVMVVDRVIH